MRHVDIMASLACMHANPYYKTCIIRAFKAEERNIMEKQSQQEHAFCSHDNSYSINLTDMIMPKK